MSGFACLFGVHSLESALFVEVRNGEPVMVRVTRCARCGARIAGEVYPLAELPSPGDGSL